MAGLKVAVWAQEETAPETAKSVHIVPKEGHSDLEWFSPDTQLIDTPSAAVLDYGSYLSQSRFFSNGGVLQYASFGVFRSLNIGASLTMDNLIGEDQAIRVRTPQAQIKYRFYDGSKVFPALALGYDGQGYRYNKVSDRYNERERGLYLAGSKEVGIPGLETSPSINISDFNGRSFFGALPLSYNIGEKASLMAEWDNIRSFRGSRLNSGVRFYLTSHFHMDLAVRSIGKKGEFSDGQERGAERIVQLWYTSSF